MKTFYALAQSRKFWVGALTIGALAATTTLVALGKIPMGAFYATMASITTTGLTMIGSIAWEDSAQKSAPATTTTTTVNNALPPAPPANGGAS